MQGNRLMLVIAVIAGVLATVLAFTYISQARSGLEVVPEQTVEVLVVKSDLAANHVLDPDQDLGITDISLDQFPELARSAVRSSEAETVRGMTTSAPLVAGVPLLHAHLKKITDIDLAPGMRAMAITVDGANMMGGLLVPGDRVDIMVSYLRPPVEAALPEIDPNDPNAAIGAVLGQFMGGVGQSAVPSDWQTEIVLESVRVIAVGQMLSVSRQAQVYGMAGLGAGGSTITLEVTPEQASTLVCATAGGANPLTLLLHDPEITRTGEQSVIGE